MPTATSEKKVVVPFGVEADEPRNGDLFIKTIGRRLRGAISAGKGTIRNVQDRENRPVIPKDQVSLQLPEVPGMQVHVDPAKLTWKIKDPLFDDEALCERIASALRNSGNPWSPEKVKGAPPERGTLDVHEMKSLVRELVGLVESNCARPAMGEVPSMEAVDALPGEYLLNPGSIMEFHQPRYEKDYAPWKDKLTMTGV